MLIFYHGKHIEKITKLAIADKSENLMKCNFPLELMNSRDKICRQAKGYWQDKYDKRISPLGKEYYWLTEVLLIKMKIKSQMRPKKGHYCSNFI